MNKKGFTLIEMIAVIIILATISFISYTSLTNTLKKNKEDDQERYEDILINAAQIYVETNLSNYNELNSIGGTIEIDVIDLIDNNYLKSDLDNPSVCEIDSTYITILKNSDNTLSYDVNCRE